MSTRVHPYTSLLLLTGLNFFNYVDRNVLFATIPLIEREIPGSKEQYGELTLWFFIAYMCFAPVVGPIADRWPRKWIIAAGAVLWSGATLLTAVTHTYPELAFRHALVGIGEATFVTVAPGFIADLFAEGKRARMLAIFYVAIGLGSAVGFMMGGYLGQHYGWRVPFYVGAAPGLVLAVAVAMMPEPQRGATDSATRESFERDHVLGLFRNGAFWSGSIAMALWTFCVGGLQAWMPSFLNHERGVSVEEAGIVFGAIVAVNSVVATLIGGWAGDWLLKRTRTAYYLFSAVTVALAVPLMYFAINLRGRAMYPLIGISVFFLFLSNGPLNAAIVDSVGARIRATAIAVNLFTIHLLGDAFSPKIIGRIADRSSLQRGFEVSLIAVILSSLVLFYGMRYAPQVQVDGDAA
jgi:MFS transporter, Spinster family, sphingosine-1-phosphate transporter